MSQKASNFTQVKTLFWRTKITPGRVLFCRVLFSFVPEKNAKYQLRPGISQEKTGRKSLFGNPFENTLCGVIVEKLGDNGAATPFAIKNLKLHQTKITCIKAVQSKATLRRGLSIMKTQLSNQQAIILDAVHYAMLVCYAA